MLNSRRPIVIVLLLFCSIPFAIAANSGDLPAIAGSNTTAAPDVISGRVLDASGSPIHGTIVIALEKQQDGTIVNETSPDANGNFTFSHVPGGDYAVFIAAENQKHVSYAPLVLLSSGSTFGTGQTISPGTHLGVIKLPRMRESSTNVVSVPVTSDHPITITLAAQISYNGHTFEWPWVNGIPTFDVPARNGRVSTVRIPSTLAFVAVFNGDNTRFAQNADTSTDLFASAYTRNSAKPTCIPARRGPNRIDDVSHVSAFNFIGCGQTQEKPGQ